MMMAMMTYRYTRGDVDDDDGGGAVMTSDTLPTLHCIVLLHMCCIIVTRWGGPGKIES